MKENRHPTDPHSTPGIATAEEGHVFLDGPNGVAITMTAQAAIATGQRLVEAGQEALRQQREDPSLGPGFPD